MSNRWRGAIRHANHKREKHFGGEGTPVHGSGQDGCAFVRDGCLDSRGWPLALQQKSGTFLMKTIPLTQGYVALVDDSDYDELIRHKWHVNIGSRSSIYARRKETRNGKRVSIYMQCQLMGITPGDRSVEVDHRDRDGLNNQRDNLRVCPHQKNSFNRKAFGGASQYRGVKRSGKKWRACLGITHIGVFESEIEAARAYDEKAMIEAGEFAVLNFPDQQPQTQGVIQ
jgi:hypothetical protein